MPNPYLADMMFLTPLLMVLAASAGGCMDPVQARAGGDRTVDGGDTVTLDASRSLPQDADRVAFKWTVLEGGDGITLSSPTAAVTTFEAPTSSNDLRVVVELKATYVDLSGQPYSPNSDRDQVLIRIRGNPGS